MQPLRHLSAGGLSLLLHGLFLFCLLFGVAWKSPPLAAVEAELWLDLPPAPAAVAPLPLPLPPAPAPVSERAAVPARPDIALAEQQAARHAAEAAREEQARAVEEAERAKRAAEREAQRRQLEQQLADEVRAELEAEESALRSQLRRQQASASLQARQIGEAQERIRSRIRNYLRLPQNLKGNPEAIYRVSLLPNGEVLRVELLRSSGQDAYDQEVERAILKASPLPLPKERDAASAFRDGLILKFRPHEAAAAGG